MHSRQANAGIWTWVRWGWMIALVMPGCESVLGLDKLREGCDEVAAICVGNLLRTCEPSGQVLEVDCEDSASACKEGACTKECEWDVDRRCDGNRPEVCNHVGQWVLQDACTTECVDGACVRPSCFGIMRACGPAGDEYCCMTEWVEGAEYDRGNNFNAKAKVGNFRLDKFEVTVARFRQFVEKYPGSMPVAGAGEHPKIPGSGWKTEWFLVKDKATLEGALTNCDKHLRSTWPVGGITVLERPINCVTWYEAFAFCAWDGGWLPTEAEWNIAAAREGTEDHNQRVYPWSNPYNSNDIDPDLASYGCLGDGDSACNVFDILKVGTKSPAGDGPWNHTDLGGNVAEWTMDWYADPYRACDLEQEWCAFLSGGTERVVRGGAWISKDVELQTSARKAANPGERSDERGFRCAYGP